MEVVSFILLHGEQISTEMPTVKPSRPVINKMVIRVSVTMGETKRGVVGRKGEGERDQNIRTCTRNLIKCKI